jgi:hypothetical protein
VKVVHLLLLKDHLLSSIVEFTQGKNLTNALIVRLLTPANQTLLFIKDLILVKSHINVRFVHLLLFEKQPLYLISVSTLVKNPSSVQIAP